MTIREAADQLLASPDHPNVGRLKPGDLNAEGTLRMVHGPYPTSDDVPQQRNEVCFHAGPGRWFAAVQAKLPHWDEAFANREVWQTQHDHVDHPTAAAAIASVEGRGGGSVVAFLLEPNLPGRLPEVQHRSVGLWSYEDGKWRGHDIYSGHGGAYGYEKPH